MVDRIETKPCTNKIDLRLQTLITSPYAQQKLQLAGLINHRGQIITSNDYLRSLAQRKRQRREREAIKQEIVLRALKIDQNNPRGRRHQFEIVTQRAVNNNFEYLSRQYRKQSYGRRKSREKSAPGFLPTAENDSEQRIRVTSAYKRILKVNKDLPESDHEQNRIEPLDKSQMISVERHVCDVTMSYGSNTTLKKGQHDRDEIVVMQQHTTGENLVIYRGFLDKGGSCRQKYFQRALTANGNTMLSDTIQNEHSQKVLQCLLTPSSDPSEETTPPAPSPGKENIEAWIDQADSIPWDTRSSPNSISTVELQELLHQSQSIRVIRLEKSVENFIYILDGNVQISNVDKTKLRGLINFGFIFNDINDKICIEFITQIVNEQIIIIVSSTTMENLDQNIRNALQIHSVYVVDDIKDYSNDFDKIRGIYPNIVNVLDQLEKDIILFTYDLNTISSVPPSDTSDSTFAYIQVLKDILLETDEKTDLKKQMLDFCRYVYADNAIQLSFIDEFEHRFRPDEAVQWYLREETFLFKMLTRTFRIPEPDILFKLRFFIQYLHRQLKSNFSRTSTIVYCTQHISNDNFDIILKNQGGFLAFSQFLLTNKSKIRAKQQTTGLPFNKSEFKLVLFQMELGTTIPKIDIDTSHKEVLISAATIFRISNVKQINKEMPIVKLTSDNDVLKAIQEVTKNVREAARGSFPLLRMAKLMKQMEYIQHTEYFCLMLMDDPKAIENEAANLIVGGLFHTLGSFYYEQEQYDRALEQLENSLNVYLRIVPPNDIKLTPTYNNMGSIYHKQGLDKQALQFHMKAYDIQVKSSNPDPESIATYAGNIASVLVQQSKYSEAIPFLQHDLQIREQLHPNGNDINLAVKYHSLAGAQFAISKYTEALENYEQCLKIELKLHPKTHPTVAVTYYNIATTLEALEKLKEAIETIQKAIARLLLTKDTNDEDVQMYKEYEKSLRQKLSVKSLCDTS
ncbi:unnamed protein product [Rotaria sp. Silwood1]|nr:unnamed protein product [Rotaria sp. Silwood1]